jgi:hypothetical protein
MFHFEPQYDKEDGHTIAQTVSRRFPTNVTRFPTQVRLYGIGVEESDTVADYIKVFKFPMQIFIPPDVPHSSSSLIQNWCFKTKMARRNNEMSHFILIKKKT